MIKLNLCCLVNHSQLFGPICAMVCNGFVSSVFFFLITNLFQVSLHLLWLLIAFFSHSFVHALSLSLASYFTKLNILVCREKANDKSTDLCFQFYIFRRTKKKCQSKIETFFTRLVLTL